MFISISGENLFHPIFFLIVKCDNELHFSIGRVNWICQIKASFKMQFHYSSLEIEQWKLCSVCSNKHFDLLFDSAGQSWGGDLHGQPTAWPTDRPERCLQRGQWHGRTQWHCTAGFRYYFCIVDNMFSIFYVFKELQIWWITDLHNKNSLQNILSLLFFGRIFELFKQIWWFGGGDGHLLYKVT